MHEQILRRFRAEVRKYPDIQYGCEVTLADHPERAPNTMAAEILLRRVFPSVTVVRAPDGLVCGSREEAGALRLAAYTRRAAVQEVFLAELVLADIRAVLAEHHITDEPFLPDTPEVRLLLQVAASVPDVRYAV